MKVHRIRHPSPTRHPVSGGPVGRAICRTAAAVLCGAVLLAGTAFAAPAGAEGAASSSSPAANSTSGVEAVRLHTFAAGEAGRTRISFAAQHQVASAAAASSTEARDGGTSGSAGEQSVTKSAIALPENIECGSVTVDKTTAATGEQVNLTVTPDFGYELGSLFVTSVSGKAVPLFADGGGRWHFIMPDETVCISGSFVSIWGLPGSYAPPWMSGPGQQPQPAPGVPEQPGQPADPGETAPETEPDPEQVPEQEPGPGPEPAPSEPENPPAQPEEPDSGQEQSPAPPAEQVPPQQESSPMPFTDVSRDDWFFDTVYSAWSRNFVSGTSVSTFSPDEELTRGMMAMLIHDMAGRPEPEGKPQFPDTTAGAWYADAVAWCTENGIVAGYSSGLFGPDDSITRQQAAAMLYRFALYNGLEEDTSLDSSLMAEFEDADTLNQYGVKPVTWAVSTGLMSGSGGLLRPHETATRAEAAALIVRYADSIGL